MEKLKIYDQENEKIIFEIPYSVYIEDRFIRKMINFLKIRAKVKERIRWEDIEKISDEIKSSAWEKNKEWIMKKVRN